MLMVRLVLLTRKHEKWKIGNSNTKKLNQIFQLLYYQHHREEDQKLHEILLQLKIILQNSQHLITTFRQ